MSLDKVALQVRLPEDLHEKLKTIANLESRSLNNTIVFFLSTSADEYFKNHPNL